MDIERKGDSMKGSTLEKKNSRIGWTMVIIASVLILAFSYIPMVQAFLLSLKTGKGNNLTFGGVANYVRMLNDTGFKTTIGNTLFYAVIQIPIMLLLALLVAVLLNCLLYTSPSPRDRQKSRMPSSA